ncbi:endo alpha-1,4 polygalactosaminidase [Clostridium algidicarnis]|uniref:Glycoside-hydrolase family GH114 TIM-barrel domain-containing protein n=1 Tax=Clostridium algidicarnis DSM 15099 TaxID=1121295 RepID=A0A2S6FZ43_9CLOT|nr:endo alpha-1,4 polygalactosaminidase [Clostridium algidicarnis]PPK48895.1 hypothetical protein BD821_10315 [Clostridium algidicarnis DSM 15099]
MFSKLSKLLVTFPLILILTSFQFNTNKSSHFSYGNFVGLSPSKIETLFSYDEIIIDASYYSKEQIKTLHDNNVKVYSYLNIGSLEKFRDYYDNFSNLIIESYENWEDEGWIDVTNISFQNFILNDLSKSFIDKGIDGFFIDNMDVYSIKANEATFNSLTYMLKELNSKYNKPIIINNGYDYVEEALRLNIDIRELFYGMNKESVFTSYDFEKNKPIKNSKEETDFLLQYLNNMSHNGINIYIIEYSKSKSFTKKLHNYYENTSYSVYVSPRISLD